MNWNPHFQSVASAITGVPQIDWNYIDSIDATDLFISQDKGVMKEIVNQFLNATYFSVQNPTRLLKLFQLLQIVVRNLTDANEKLKKLARSKIKENEKLKVECEKAKCKSIGGPQCPICQKMFISLQYVDRHIFARHPAQAAIWQALRAPHYAGLTKTHDPITSQGDIKQMLEKMTDHFSMEMKSSELDIQQYFKKQLKKMKKALCKNSRKPKLVEVDSSSEKESPRVSESDEEVLIIPVQDIEYIQKASEGKEDVMESHEPPKEEVAVEEEQEVQVTTLSTFTLSHHEPVTESQKVFLLSDSHVSDVIPVGDNVRPSVLVAPVSSSGDNMLSSSMENVNLQDWRPSGCVGQTQPIRMSPMNTMTDDPTDGINNKTAPAALLGPESQHDNDMEYSDSEDIFF